MSEGKDKLYLDVLADTEGYNVQKKLDGLKTVIDEKNYVEGFQIDDKAKDKYNLKPGDISPFTRLRVDSIALPYDDQFRNKKRLLKSLDTLIPDVNERKNYRMALTVELQQLLRQLMQDRRKLAEKQGEIEIRKNHLKIKLREQQKALDQRRVDILAPQVLHDDSEKILKKLVVSVHDYQERIRSTKDEIINRANHIDELDKEIEVLLGEQSALIKQKESMPKSKELKDKKQEQEVLVKNAQTRLLKEEVELVELTACLAEEELKLQDLQVALDEFNKIERPFIEDEIAKIRLKITNLEKEMEQIETETENITSDIRRLDERIRIEKQDTEAYGS